jgi:general secretion pathway protein D
VDANQTGSGGSGNNNGNSGGGAVGSTITYTVETLPFGPALDVIPYVSADGYSVQMTIIPTLTEFLGYDTSGAASAFISQAQGSSGGTLTAILPLPNSRVRQITTTAVVWDGQTIVLGGLITENTTKTKDKVPVLGDLPMLGRLFRSESSFRKKKNLLIFVTPTIIDPAGNRVHADEELPFTRSNVPSQPAAHKVN